MHVCVFIKKSAVKKEDVFEMTYSNYLKC